MGTQLSLPKNRQTDRGDSSGSKEACVTWECSLLPPDEYDWTAYMLLWRVLFVKLTWLLVQNAASNIWPLCVPMYTDISCPVTDMSEMSKASTGFLSLRSSGRISNSDRCPSLRLLFYSHYLQVAGCWLYLVYWTRARPFVDTRGRAEISSHVCSVPSFTDQSSRRRASPLADTIWGLCRLVTVHFAF